MVDGYFGLREKGTNVRTEVIAGFTTFLTMAYIIFVNPDILSAAGMDKGALIAVTCIVAAISTIATGIIGNAPIAMAPGMGVNAFFAYTLVIGSEGKVSWQTALGVVFLSGVLMLIFTLVGLRKKLVEAIPSSLIAAISVGIGLFITFIGLQNLGIVVDHPVTLVTSAHIDKTILIGLAGLAIMIVLEMKKVPGALLIGIASSTIIAAVVGKVDMPDKLMDMNVNIAPIAFKADIFSAFRLSMVTSVFTLMFIDMFDSIGTLLAVAPDAGLADKDGNIKKIDRLLTIDAGATMFGAICGTSTTTSYVESAAGIEQGGRSGLTSVVTGLLFLVAMLFVPLVGIVPSYATAPALIMVGMFMMKNVKRIDFSDMEHGLPSFIIVVMIALSYSISTGLAFGFIAYTLIQIAAGKIGQIKPAMWVIALLSLLYFCSGLIEQVIG